MTLRPTEAALAIFGGTLGGLAALAVWLLVTEREVSRVAGWVRLRG